MITNSTEASFQLVMVNGLHPSNMFGDVDLSAKSCKTLMKLCNANRQNAALPENIRRFWFGGMFGTTFVGFDYMAC